MKKILTVLSAVALLAALCLSLAGCGEALYVLDSDGVKINCNEADFIQEKYNADECRAEAERLFGTTFKVVASDKPSSGEDRSRYTLRSEDIPFDINVYSDRTVSCTNGLVCLNAHAYCDYYEQMMEHTQSEADAIAEQYGLEVKREGQCATVSVSSYAQLEKVYDYLDATNRLYSFTLKERFITNILRDIRTRPTLDVYLDREAFELPEDADGHVITLYYTINRDTYDYTRDALLSTIQETYIDVLDELGVKDSAVTAGIRSERCKPALTQLCINGVPVEPKDLGDYVLDANIVFDYNWLMNDYYGDIRICAPAEDYTAAPSSTGDDRNFMYLVELLGGRYVSYLDVWYSATAAYYMADWWLGGNSYGAGTLCQEHIPTMSAFSVNETGIVIDHVYSKEMWGLENGYGPEDYHIRLTPKALAKLLGVTAEPDYEKGTLNLVTPEGYFDFEPPAAPEQIEINRFYVEKISINGIPNNASHYIIFNKDGSILEERFTEQDTYAECEQLTSNIVMLKMHGAGMSDNITLFDTATGFISDVYNYAQPVQYPYVIYSPNYTTNIIIENVLTGAQTIITDDAYESSMAVISASFSLDMSQITVTYNRPDVLEYYVEVTETFDIVLPE